MKTKQTKKIVKPNNTIIHLIKLKIRFLLLVYWRSTLCVDGALSITNNESNNQIKNPIISRLH